MVRAEGCQAFEHCVDLDLGSEEGVEGFGVISGVAGGHGGAPCRELHRFLETTIALPG